MTRVFLAAVVLAALPLASGAEEPAVRLGVRPMRAPIPALKYQLLPDVRELNPGNPAQWYVRCFQEQRNFFYGKEAVAERARYQSLPLAELPAETLRQYGRNALDQADWGARLDAIDWQVLERVQSEGSDLTLVALSGEVVVDYVPLIEQAVVVPEFRKQRAAMAAKTNPALDPRGKYR